MQNVGRILCQVPSDDFLIQRLPKSLGFGDGGCKNAEHLRDIFGEYIDVKRRVNLYLAVLDAAYSCRNLREVTRDSAVALTAKDSMVVGNLHLKVFDHFRRLRAPHIANPWRAQFDVRR